MVYKYTPTLPTVAPEDMTQPITWNCNHCDEVIRRGASVRELCDSDDDIEVCPVCGTPQYFHASYVEINDEWAANGARVHVVCRDAGVLGRWCGGCRAHVHR